ncbi:MAG: molybdenum cofactor guanylyltransferase [Acidobacteriota bacterium]
MRFRVPAAVLAGGASRRMGRPKAALPYGPGTLLEHQTSRLFELFDEVWVVAKGEPPAPLGVARLLLDRTPDLAAIHGVVRALEECEDAVFVLGVDLPLVAPAVIRGIVERGRTSAAPAVLPESDGELQPLAALWTRRVLEAARQNVLRGELSLARLATGSDAAILREAEWRALDPSGNSFANVNTVEEYLAVKDRA